MTELGVRDAQARRAVVVRREGKPDMHGVLVFWPIPADERDPEKQAQARARRGGRKNQTGTRARVEVGKKKKQISVPTDTVHPA